MTLNLAIIIEKKYTSAIQCFAAEDVRCDIENCGKKYADKSGCIRHLRLHHRTIFNVIKQSQKQPPIISPELELELRVQVNPKEIINACVELIVMHALPLKVVEYPAFRKLLDPYTIALRNQGINLVINPRNIRKCIEEKAAKVKKCIILAAKKNILSVMVDIATRYNRSLLGVNICYMDNGKIIARTIGMHPLHFSHTAENIAAVIKQNLEEYEILLDQVVSVTSDNGRNIIEAVSELDDCYQHHLTNDNDEYIDPDIFDAEYYEHILSQVRSSFNEVFYTNIDTWHLLRRSLFASGGYTCHQRY